MLFGTIDRDAFKIQPSHVRSSRRTRQIYLSPCTKRGWFSVRHNVTQVAGLNTKYPSIKGQPLRPSFQSRIDVCESVCVCHSKRRSGST